MLASPALASAFLEKGFDPLRPHLGSGSGIEFTLRRYPRPVGRRRIPRLWGRFEFRSGASSAYIDITRRGLNPDRTEPLSIGLLGPQRPDL